MLAASTMIASPILAATRTVPITVPLSARPVPAPGWSVADETFDEHRWRRYRHHRDGIDGGDLLAGILVIGGIAAIASAADKNRERRADRRDYPTSDRPYDYRADPRDRDFGGGNLGGGRSEIDRAVDACSAEAARAGQVDEIFDVERIDGEWRIKGDYRNGREFTCTVDGNGRAYVGRGDQAREEVLDAPGGDDDTDDRYATAGSPDFTDPR
jgi:hypothetical protein